MPITREEMIILKGEFNRLFTTLPRIIVGTGTSHLHLSSFLASNETFATYSQRGFASLIPGIYKIVGEIQYRPVTSEYRYPTHYAKVLCMPMTADAIYEISLNIGPMTNGNFRYNEPPGPDTHNSFVQQFLNERANDNRDNFFMTSKTNFYKRLKDQQLFFRIYDNNVLSSGERQCIWMLVDELHY